jgi:acyl-CoA thioester hydrolase
MTIVYSHRVRYHEADAQGFLFNSRYLEVASDLIPPSNEGL